MSESRDFGESRGYGYTPSYGSVSSESRDSGESRGLSYVSVYGYTPSSSTVSGESKDSVESKNNCSSQLNSTKYNNLDDIDTLIEKLEKEQIETTCNSSEIQAQISKRKQKIEQLKKLREQANEAQEKAQILEKIKADNHELDEAIRSAKQLVKKPQQKKQSKKSSGEFNGYCSKMDDIQYCRDTSPDYGESRDSGESRW